MRRRRSIIDATLASAACLILSGDALGAAEEPQPAVAPVEAQAAHTHHMSADDLAVLRRKVPLYKDATDEQINESMSRMADLTAYISPAGVRNGVGVLALGHGYGEPGNTMFTDAYRPIGAKYPTAAGLGMSMMSSFHIQTAVNELEKAGARLIVVLPTEIGDDTSLIRQWQYIFNRPVESSYLDVPRVTSKAKIVLARTPTTSPLLGEILVDYAKSAIKSPASEAAILIAHGPETAEDNVKLLKVLEGHAAKIKAATGLSEVHFDCLQDDAPAPIRTANVNRMRDWIQQQTANGKRVIVLQVIMTGQGGVTRRIKRDLDGLQFELVDKGIAEHPLFRKWVSETVAAAQSGSGGV